MALGVVIGLAVVLPVALAAANGSLAIPHNDTWAYSLVAQQFAETGGIDQLFGSRGFLLGQVVVLGPLGESIVAQQLFVATLAALGLIATFLLFRTRLSRERALFATAVVGVFPGLGLLATSFMQDVPAYFATVTALWLGAVAVRRGSLAGVTGAVAIGVWGFTIREQALAAIVSVLVAACVARTDRSTRMRIIGIAAVTFVGLAALESWRQSFPGANPPVIGLGQWRSGVRLSIAGIFSLGLAVLPATLAIARPSSWGPRSRLAAACAALAGAALYAKYDTVLMGNYLTQDGAYSVMSVGRREVLPDIVWLAVQLAAWIGGTLLVGTAVDRARRLDLVIWLFGVLTVLGTVFAATTGQFVFDRYLLPLVPVALLVVLSASAAERQHPRVVAGVGSLAALGFVSLAITVNTLAFDSARWDAAERLVSTGVQPQAVDAGLEWIGYQQHVRPANIPHSSIRQDVIPRYAQALDAAECYVVSSSAQPGLGRLVRSSRYRSFMVAGRSQLRVYDTGRCEGAG